MFILTRDIIVAICFVMILILFKKNYTANAFNPNLWGKLTTALQYLVCYDILLFREPHHELIGLAGISSVASAISYSTQFYLELKSGVSPMPAH